MSKAQSKKSTGADNNLWNIIFKYEFIYHRTLLRHCHALDPTTYIVSTKKLYSEQVIMYIHFVKPNMFARCSR